MALTYEEIRGLNWFIADQVRDKGNGNNNDAMSVAIPILIFKRLLDMRKEYKNQFNSPIHKEQYNIMQLYGDIDQSIANYQNNAPVFAVKSTDLHLYRIEWADIMNFPDEHNSTNILNYNDSFEGEYSSLSHNKIEFIEEIINGFADDKIREIFNYFDFKTKINSNNISQILTYQEFSKLLKELNKYDLSLSNAPSDVFSEAYMDLLKRFAPQKGSKQGEFFTPNTVSKGGIKLLDPSLLEEGIINVSDPTSGACTFLVEFVDFIKQKYKDKLSFKEISEKIKLVMQEKDRVSFAAGEANLLLHGVLNRTEAFHGNTIEEYSSKIGLTYENKCHYILANPPYGLDDYGYNFALDTKKSGNELSRWSYGVPNAGDGELAFMQTILALLEDQGKAVVVSSMGPLSWDSGKIFRQFLVEQKDWLEGLVLLPRKLFNTTDIQVCFWIFNKNKSDEDKNHVFIINSEHDFKKNKTRNTWDYEKSVELYLSRQEIEDYSKKVSVKTLKDNDFDFSVKKYVYKKQEIEEINILDSLNYIEKLNISLDNEKEKISSILLQIKELYKEDEND